jgi:tRNA-splicing ligase RtcB (3'-phosphate/5'-hydroxy nucleic acid ligase)
LCVTGVQTCALPICIEYQCSFCERKIKGKGGLRKHEKSCSKNNHKVLLVRALNQKEDVYCLQVEKFHNFAIASGVFVHNCGMLSINIGKELKHPLPEIDHKIRQRVPFGFETHEHSVIDMEKEFPWRTVNSDAQKFALAYQEKFGAGIDMPHYDMKWFQDKCATIGCNLGRAIKSIGTIGSGNHFQEIGLSQVTGDYWVTIHTGSRNIGKCICEYWQNRAIGKIVRRSKEEHREAVRLLKATYKGKELYDKIKEFKSTPAPVSEFQCSDDLRWLEGKDAHAYLFDMLFAQAYAVENRKQIMRIVTEALKVEPTDTIETVHNFVDFKDFIIRKGAVRSYTGERYILPFNMRDGLLICTGKSSQIGRAHV